MSLLRAHALFSTIAGVAGGARGVVDPGGSFLAVAVGGVVGAGLGFATFLLCVLPLLSSERSPGPEKPTPAWLNKMHSALVTVGFLASPVAAFLLPYLAISSAWLWLKG